jgi:hypothetical protein
MHPHRRSGADLRADLDKDSAIFNLKERLGTAESKMGHREKELQSEIERLRADIRTLTHEKVQLAKQAANPQFDLLKAKDVELERLRDAKTGLQGKLEWYAENQQLLDATEREKSELQSVNAVMKRELKKRGMDPHAIQGLHHFTNATDYAEGEKETDMGLDESTTSAGTRGGMGQNKSRLADTKKIKELEATVTELQESLRKRNPDSVSNLVRAAAMSEEVQVERREEQAEVEAMRVEMAQAKADFELRLRSLRQEHERVGTQYKKRIEDLEGSNQEKGDRASTRVSTGGSSSNSSPGSGNSGGEKAKTLAAANAKIVSLEEETERIRTFYTKKVEEEKRKAEVQIQAIKRGDGLGRPSDGMSYGNSTSTATAKEDTPVNVKGAGLGLGQSAASEEDKWKNEMAAIRVDYEEQLQTLKIQLDTIKAQGGVSEGESASESASESSPSKGDVMVQNVRESELFTAEVAKEVEARVAAYRAANSSLSASTAAPAVDLARINALQDESDASRRRAVEAEHRVGMLEGDIATLRAQLTAQASSVQGHSVVHTQLHQVQPNQAMMGPDMTIVNRLESHVVELETRLSRREADLQSAIENSRAGNKMERARMQAIHAAEIREKDEQLVKFQTELEQLVYALRQWQGMAVAANEANNANNVIPVTNISMRDMPDPVNISINSAALPV